MKMFSPVLKSPLTEVTKSLETIHLKSVGGSSRISPPIVLQISRKDGEESTCLSANHSENYLPSPYKTPTRSDAINTRSCRSISAPLLDISNLHQITQKLCSSPEMTSVLKKHSCILPTIKGSQPDLNSITPQTLCDVISGQYDHHFNKICIVDCRYDYEYNGGHVMNAIHLRSPDNLQKMFIDGPDIPQGRTAIIFYCEYSSKRGPSCYRKLRDLDRKSNISNYPYLHYPDIYLLEGGYRTFFGLFKDYCDPQNYVEMFDKRYCDQMKKHTREKSFRKRLRVSSTPTDSKDCKRRSLCYS